MNVAERFFKFLAPTPTRCVIEDSQSRVKTLQWANVRRATAKAQKLYAVLAAYYYMAYAVRRLLGADGATKNFAKWRAVGLLILIQVQLVMALIYVVGRKLFQYGTAVQWGYGVAIPVIALTYWLLDNRRAYEKAVRVFEPWSNRKRAIADVAALLFAIVSAFRRSLPLRLPGNNEPWCGIGDWIHAKRPRPNLMMAVCSARAANHCIKRSPV